MNWINLIAIGVYAFVLVLQVQNYVRNPVTNGAAFTRKLFIGQIIALVVVSFCLLISPKTIALNVAAGCNIYLACMSLVFYKQ